MARQNRGYQFCCCHFPNYLSQFGIDLHTDFSEVLSTGGGGEGEHPHSREKGLQQFVVQSQDGCQ